MSSAPAASLIEALVRVFSAMATGGFDFGAVGSNEAHSFDFEADEPIKMQADAGNHAGGLLPMLLHTDSLDATTKVMRGCGQLPLGTEEQLSAVGEAQGAFESVAGCGAGSRVFLDPNNPEANRSKLAEKFLRLALGTSVAPAVFEVKHRWSAVHGPLIAGALLRALQLNHGMSIETVFAKFGKGARALVTMLRASNMWSAESVSSPAAVLAGKRFDAEQAKAYDWCRANNFLPGKRKRREGGGSGDDDTGGAAAAVSMVALTEAIEHHGVGTNVLIQEANGLAVMAAMEQALHDGNTADSIKDCFKVMTRDHQIALRTQLEHHLKKLLDAKIQKTAMGQVPSAQATARFGEAQGLPTAAMNAAELSAKMQIGAGSGMMGGDPHFGGLAGSAKALDTSALPHQPHTPAIANMSVPMPTTYVPPNALLRPCYFDRSLSALDQMVRSDDGDEMVMSSTAKGTLSFKRKVSSKLEYRMMPGCLEFNRAAIRLSLHCVAHRNWHSSTVNAHALFVGRIMDLHLQNGHPWAEVSKIEDTYRKRMFCSLETSWDNEGALATLMTLSLTKGGAGPAKAPGTKAGSLSKDNPRWCHGIAVCLNWNRGSDCKVKPCKYKHVCSSCHGSHKQGPANCELPVP